MNTKRIISCLLAATFAAGFGLSGAIAGPLPVASPDVKDVVVLAKGGCYAVGEAIAAQNGGKLAAAREAKSGGKSVCVIVVLIPGQDGQRPRRQEFVIPQ